MKSKIASISDVAETVSVSIKTVSRVINNEPHVTEKTKAKVVQAIHSLGYTPSVSARTLASKRSYCIAMICRTTRNDYIASFQLGAMSTCQSQGFNLFVSLIEDYDQMKSKSLQDRLSQLFKGPNPDNVLLFPPLCDNTAVLEFLRDENVGYVRVSPFRHDYRSPVVGIDERQAAYDLTRHLIELGHERIAFIRNDPAHGATSIRAKDFEDALEDVGLSVEPDLILDGDFHFLSGLTAGAQLCAMKDRPTAIFASNDEMAAGAMISAHGAGLSIPQDMSLVGFDDTLVAKCT